MTRFCFLLVLLALVVPASADELKLEAVLPQKDGLVKCVAFSPDGNTLVAASENSISVWTTRTWKMRESLRYGTTSLAFAGEGAILAYGSGFQVGVFDLSSENDVFTAAGGQINSVALAPNGTVLAAGGVEGVHLWEARSGKKLNGPGWFNTEVNALAFSGDGKFLAIGDVFGRLAVWDVSAGKQLAPFAGHRNFITSVAYSGDSATIVSGGGDDTIRMWEAKTRRERLQIPVDSPFGFFHIALNRDGTKVAAVGDDGIVKFWDARDGKKVASLSQHERGFSIAFSPDGKLVAVGLRTKVNVWKLVNGRR